MSFATSKTVGEPINCELYHMTRVYLKELLPYTVFSHHKTLLYIPSKPRLVPNDLDLPIRLELVRHVLQISCNIRFNGQCTVPQWFLQLSATPRLCFSPSKLQFSSSPCWLVPVAITGLHSIKTLVKQKFNKLVVTFSVPHGTGSQHFSRGWFESG